MLIAPLRGRFRRRRREHGVVAVVVAVSCVMLFAVSALAVDLGSAFVRKRDVQAQADFAALGAARDLVGNSTTPVSTDPAVAKAAQYLFYNQPSDDAGTSYTQAQLQTMLTDGSTSNGQAYYGHFAYSVPGGVRTLVQSKTELTIVTPPRLVKYGLGAMFGASSTSVSAKATVGIYSPKASVFPAFAVSGCDQGPQTITDPAAGHVTDINPNLASSTDDNIVVMTPPNPGTGVTNPTPSQIGVAPSSPVQITISGTNLDKVTKIGFFKEPTSGSPIAPTAAEQVASSDTAHFSWVGNSIKVTLPLSSGAITDAEQLWWIRAWAPTTNNGSTYAWSTIRRSNGALNTLAFRVGTPYLRCAGTSNQGNYGTIKVPRTDTTSANWLPYNMATGFQEPLTLGIHPDTSSATCNPNDPPPTVFSPTTGNPSASDLKPQTNCVQTDTGLTANASTSALITGPGSGVRGRLKAQSGQSNCSGRTRLVATSGNVTTEINDDILTCYLPAGITVASVADDTYTGAPVISSDIFKSPRFFWQPILGTSPGTGTSYYRVVDMRPAFLTDQPLGASNGSPQVAADNGVVIDTGSVVQLNVVFLNANAIKQPDGGAVMQWIGGNTPKVLRLTN